MELEKQEKILTLIKQINIFAQTKIQAPDCIHIEDCTANCCYTTPNLPKILVLKLIKLKLAEEDDFTKSDTLAYRIKLNPITSRCKFYDPELNGCKLHKFQIKPPQCALYPLHERNPAQKCRLGYKFEIKPTDYHRLINLFNEYYDLAREEFYKINNEKFFKANLNSCFSRSISQIPPCKFLGIQELITEYEIKISQKPNFLLMPLCEAQECNTPFFECKSICFPIQKSLQDYYLKYFEKIKEKGIFQEDHLISKVYSLVED